MRNTYSGRSRSREARVGHQPMSRESSLDAQREPMKQKLGRPHSEVSEAGDLVLPTPFLRRVRSQHPSSPPQPQSPCAKKAAGLSAKRSEPDAYIATVRSMTDDPKRQTSYLGILRAFGKLLLVTTPKMDRPASADASAAPKSLLAMCLRKAPDVIASLEHQDLLEAEENRTKSLDGLQASFDVYSELESLGAFDGWRHLCAVVRSHGLRILADAVTEGLIELPFAMILARHAIQLMPLAECEVFVDALVLRQYPESSGLYDSVLHSPALLPLQVLFKDWASLSLCPLGLAKLTHILAQSLLPSSWLLVGDFGSIHATAAQALARKCCSQELLEFITTSVILLCKMMLPGRGHAVTENKQAARKKLVGILKALSSMVLLANETPENARKLAPDHATTITRRMEYIVQSSLAALEGESPGRLQLHSYLLSLSGFIVAGEACYRQSITSAWSNLEGKNQTRPWAEHYDATISFLCAVANCCSRGAHTPVTPAHASLLRLCDKLAELPLPGQPLKNIRADGAFHLANLSGDLRDLVFAERLQTDASPLRSVSPGQGRDLLHQKTNPSFAGFRWDKDISEWVTATPQPGRRVRPSSARLRLRSAAHESLKCKKCTETICADTDGCRAARESPRVSETSTEDLHARDTSVLTDEESIFSNTSLDSASVTPSESISDENKEMLDEAGFSRCKFVADRIMVLGQVDNIPNSRRGWRSAHVKRANADPGEKDELCSDQLVPWRRRTLGTEKVVMGLRCSGKPKTAFRGGIELFPHDTSDDELGA